MQNILDRIAARPAFPPFRPSTALEFFALRLAAKLGDADVAAHYAALTARHSQETVLLALRKAMAHRADAAEQARRFHAELGALRERGLRADHSRLMAIKVERRSIAVAIFVGDHLDYAQTRHLSSAPDRAEASAVGFVNWTLANFEAESAAMESIVSGSELRRAALSRAVMATLRDSSLPIWELSKRALLDAYGHPPLRSRKQLRLILTSIIWQMQGEASNDDQILDAAALGLMVQTDRIFPT